MTNVFEGGEEVENPAYSKDFLKQALKDLWIYTWKLQ